MKEKILNGIAIFAMGTIISKVILTARKRKLEEEMYDESQGEE